MLKVADILVLVYIESKNLWNKNSKVKRKEHEISKTKQKKNSSALYSKFATSFATFGQFF